jgi:CheY-like chemotaxis protein
VAKILVADDNSNIQKMVGLALKDQGIDVVAVGNGEAAVRKLADVKPDLVLADVFMPVRNGYEVCKYIKDDPAFAHIPVILLVGAFDPLDEQEAQRVGADGVLKKPFVPPDPLIAMVKSALARAGVQIGAAAAEKAPETSRSAADMLASARASKMAEHMAAVPPPAPEPEEEFPTPLPAPVKISAGSEPVAFGSLMQTSEEEAEDLAVTAKPAIEHDWNTRPEEEEVEEEAEEEEDSTPGRWRPTGGVDDDLDQPAASSDAVPDWREPAFHGSSPARSGGRRVTHWTPTVEKNPVEEVEAAATTTAVAVAVTTLEPVTPVKTVEAAPFSGDAWAAAMAAGVEEKNEATVEHAAPVQSEPEPAHTFSEAAISQPAISEPVVEHYQAPEPSHFAPAAETSPEPEEIHAPAAYAEPEVSAPVASAYHSAPVHEVAETHENSIVQEAASFTAAPEPSFASTSASPWEVEAKKVSQLASTWDVPVAKSPNDTQEITPYEAGKLRDASDAAAEAAIAAAEAHRTSVASNALDSLLQANDASAQGGANPPVDEVVARVLQKLSPDVLQKVTQEILKPIIEALVKDEINGKKS